MKKRFLLILTVFALWVPVITYAEDPTYGEVLLPPPASTRSQYPSVLYPREWYILEKIPTGKGLGIGVFLFQEGLEHIHSVFGKPKEVIIVEVKGYDGTILVYPHHHFFFSKTGELQTIKERKL